MEADDWGQRQREILVGGWVAATMTEETGVENRGQKEGLESLGNRWV